MADVKRSVVFACYVQNLEEKYFKSVAGTTVVDGVAVCCRVSQIAEERSCRDGCQLARESSEMILRVEMKKNYQVVLVSDSPK